jgi:enoyl-CoA hydratase
VSWKELSRRLITRNTHDPQQDSTKERNMTKDEVLYTVDGGVATVTINRPMKYNALNTAVIEKLRELMKNAEEDDSVHAVVLTGAGDRAFAAGADISEFKGRDSASVRPLAENGQKLCKYIETMSKPVMAAVNGFALGGGCEIAMACDIRYASANAKFGQPEINLGIIPGFGGTVRLPRLVGLGRAKELVYTGEQIDAQEAHRIGLVNKVFADCNSLYEATKELAKKLAQKPGMAMGAAKSSLNKAWTLPLGENLGFEVDAFCKTFDTEDMKEGVSAFLEKRKPEFEHK